MLLGSLERDQTPLDLLWPQPAALGPLQLVGFAGVVERIARAYRSDQPREIVAPQRDASLPETIRGQLPLPDPATNGGGGHAQQRGSLCHGQVVLFERNHSIHLSYQPLLFMSVHSVAESTHPGAATSPHRDRLRGVLPMENGLPSCYDMKL